MTQATNENKSVYRLRWIGYGLLVFAFIDVVQILFPPQFMNPAWELETIGQLIERIPVPLLGLALVFFGEFYDRVAIEKILLRVLSWLSIVLAVLFLLLAPYGIVSALRIDGQAGQQITQQVDAQMNQLKQLEDQMNQSKPEEIKNLATQLSSQGITVDTSNPENLKTEVISRIGKVRETLQARSKAGRSEQQMKIYKNSIKWSLGALISSALFFILWKTTDWAR